jgi:hypothetical protein
MVDATATLLPAGINVIMTDGHPSVANPTTYGLVDVKLACVA